MSNSVVSSVYSGVIKDVIENVKKDFEDSGVEESVLKELERIWDRKIRNAKVATWEANGLSNDDPSQNTNNGSNAMYTYKPDIGSKFSGETPPSLTQQSSQPSASHHGSKVSSGGEISAHTTHHMYKTDNIGYSFDSLDETQTQQQTTQPLYSSVADYPNRAINTMTNNGVGKPSHPIHYPHTPTQATLAPPSDSPSSLTSYPTDVYVSSNNFSIDQKNKFQPTPQMKQLDVKLVPRSINNPSQQLPEFRREPSLLDNDDINSDLDDSDEEDTNADGEETQNIILCLYDKVTRTKNKWKCQLKDGIMSMNGRDYLFQKGNGDFEF